MITKQEFAQRRKRLLKQMTKDSIAIIAAAAEVHRNADTEYKYRQNSDFYYLTGFKEPQAVAVFIPGRKEGEFILFNRPKNPAMEVWTGKFAGQQGAVQDYEADQAFAIDELDEMMLGLLQDKHTVYYHAGRDQVMDETIMQWVHELQQKVRHGVRTPTEFISLSSIVHEMRLIKSPAEIKIMSKAAQISVAAHNHTMRTVKPGMKQYQLQAELEYLCKKSGCADMAYTSIVASGAHNCILHYIDNDQEIHDGDLVLIDAGGEYQYYSSDITRTFPANGKFTKEQAIIYELVLAVQSKIIEMVKPGVEFIQLRQTTQRLITEGLIKLGLIKGSVDKAIEERKYRDFFMHDIGHWLGLDTHDVAGYRMEKHWRKLQAGMVLTVEPGIYIAADNKQVDKKWRGIGVRIEDDVLVTRTGRKVLTEGLPRTVTEVEALVQSGK